jgi:hypothetical protein
MKKESWSQLVALPFSPARVIYRSFAFPPAVSLHFHFCFFFPSFRYFQGGALATALMGVSRVERRTISLSLPVRFVYSCTEINPLHPFSPFHLVHLVILLHPFSLVSLVLFSLFFFKFFCVQCRSSNPVRNDANSLAIHVAASSGDTR